MALKKPDPPRISINQLAEFMMAKAARQRQIIRNQKFKQDYLVVYYKEASEAVSLCLASNMTDVFVIENAIAKLEQMKPDKIGTQRRLAANVGALETFQGMLDEISFWDASPELGEQSPPRLAYHGVEVSVRPEIILTANGKGKQLVGAAKIYMSRTTPLTDVSAGYISAALQEHCRRNLAHRGDFYGPMCPVVDVGSKRVFPGVKSTAARLKDVAAACQNIAALWGTVTEGE